MEESPGFSTTHQLISLRIAAALHAYAESAKLGHILQAPCNVVLSRNEIIQPDILFVRRSRRGMIGQTGLWGPPDIVIDILAADAGRKEIGNRRRSYSHSGVGESWVVDPTAKSIEVSIWSELGYAIAGIFKPSDRLSTPALPKLKLSLRSVFSLLPSFSFPRSSQPLRQPEILCGCEHRRRRAL